MIGNIYSVRKSIEKCIYLILSCRDELLGKVLEFLNFWEKKCYMSIEVKNIVKVSVRNDDVKY